MTHPPITLKAGEKTYRLPLGFNELCAIEDEFSLPLFHVVARFGDASNVRMGDFRRLLGTLLHDEHDKKLSPELVSEVLQIAGPEAVTEAGAAALKQVLDRLGTKAE